MEATLAAVIPEPLRNRAVASLRDAILSGRLLPGTRLVEVQLAESLGVSRGTLRQAFRELEHAGLVVSVPYRGTYVAEQTANTLRDAYALRGLLEGFAAAQIPVEVVPSVTAVQRDRLEQMRRALNEGRYADVATIDIEFHASLCAITSNRRLRQVWDSLSAPLQARYANEVESLYTPTEVIARHEAIIALLEADHPGAIEAGIRGHYLETARRMATAMEPIGERGGRGNDESSEEGDGSWISTDRPSIVRHRSSARAR